MTESLLLLLSCLASFGFAFALTWWLRRVALRQGIIDVPNQRSSHSVPTPRGGGVSFVMVASVALLLFALLYEQSMFWLVVPAVGIAGVGYLDDRYDLSARLRMVVHVIAAVMVVYGVGGLPSLTLFEQTLQLGFYGDVLAVVALVWLLNLYNFMDGINGIASIEAVTTTLVIALLAFTLNMSGAGFVACLIGAAVLGFLLWNFPIGRIFMGDAGSGYLGFLLGSMGLWMAQINEVWLWAWLIMLGVFIVDATFTLLRRLVRGEKIYQAHCSHAYQMAVKRHKNHVVVSSWVAVINLAWLGPLSWAVVNNHIDGFLGLIIAYIPLLVTAIYYKAGSKQ